MKRFLQVALCIVAVVSGIMLYSLLRDAQWTHTSLKSILVMLPELGTVFAVFELEHSAKANEFRKERNELERVNIELAEENTRLQSERNEHLAEIARQMKRPQTLAERNAAKLRQHLNAQVAVINADNSKWGLSPQIVEVTDDNIAALFIPMAHDHQATVTYADCGDLEIMEIAEGACPLRLKVNKTHGGLVQLGEITKWEDRKKSAATPVFERGSAAYYARFGKQGSSETRTLFVYSSKDEANAFQFEASTGEQFVGNNKEVSIRFLSQQVEYLSDGFHRSTAGTGESHYPLFVC